MICQINMWVSLARIVDIYIGPGILVAIKETNSEKLFCNYYDSYGDPRFQLLGNLHENPELWEKVK